MERQLCKHDPGMGFKCGGGSMIRMPEYTDGYFELCEISEVKENDYPVEIIKKTGMKIWYREISVFDRMRYEFEQGNKEITMKIRIPRYKGIDSKCVCLIDDVPHLVYNAAHIESKEGFQETELTLMRPDKELSVA